MRTIAALLKRIVKSALRSAVAMLGKSPIFRDLVEKLVLERLSANGRPNQKVKWTALDQVFTAIRRQLLLARGWRYGTPFVNAVATRTFRELARYAPIEAKVYCDIGCGRYHPYGVSAVMYINGAASTIAVDLKAADVRRAAEALYDLLVDCLAHPRDWHLSSISEQEYFNRIHQFDLKALRSGDLVDGLADTPLQHIIGDIRDIGIQAESIDLMSSTAVL